MLNFIQRIIEAKKNEKLLEFCAPYALLIISPLLWLITAIVAMSIHSYAGMFINIVAIIMETFIYLGVAYTFFGVFIDTDERKKHKFTITQDDTEYSRKINNIGEALLGASRLAVIGLVFAFVGTIFDVSLKLIDMYHQSREKTQSAIDEHNLKVTIKNLSIDKDAFTDRVNSIIIERDIQKSIDDGLVY